MRHTRMKGYEVTDPLNPTQGYRLVRNVCPGETVRANQFEPFGGARMLNPGERLPDYLEHALQMTSPSA